MKTNLGVLGRPRPHFTPSLLNLLYPNLVNHLIFARL